MCCHSLHCAIRLVSLLALILVTAPAVAEEGNRVMHPNYQQASQYSSEYLRQFLYDTSVTPHWIGKTDQFWYAYRTSRGTQYYRVNPKLATRTPLFDQVKLASLLTELVQKPIDSAQLPLSRASVNDEGTKLKFVIENLQYEYDLNTESLVKLGKAPPAPTSGPPEGIRTREELEKWIEERRKQQEEQRRDQDEQQKQEQQQDDMQKKEQTEGDKTAQQGTQQQGSQQQGTQQGESQTRSGQPSTASRRPDHRSYAPDRKAYVFAQGHNLYYVEIKDEKKEEPKRDESKSEEPKKDADKSAEPRFDDEKKDEAKKDDDKKDETKKDEVKKDDEKKAEATKAEAAKPQEKPAPAKPPVRPAEVDHDPDAIQLSTDGVEDYSFASSFGVSRSSGGSSREGTTTLPPDRKTRPNVTWSKDSKSFYVARSDSRGLEELWVINSLANPRPTLEKYKYPMPGEDKIRKTELYYLHRDGKKLTRVAPKWKDESYSNVQWDKTGDVLRFLRRDRLLRHVELCALNVVSGECKCLISEGFENAYQIVPTMRALDETDEMIWWTERTGWAHFYLYDRNGTLKNAITSGPYRASRIVDVDTKNRMLYFLANAREPDENIYYEHLYCVHLDGTGLQVMDPGAASHRSILSPSKQYLVDNCSRVDQAPCSVLRDASGRKILDLESADLSRLNEVGWRLPDSFAVKAADGVTDLYGNMWKPFDFDPNKRYPIIANVYPGPQTEGTTHTFSATSGTQQLAQLGFIVIQVGHRGGAPTRSKSYASYGYFNMRDYGLADKKAAIEQLAARHKYIDIARVGLYGHSGGGFMTAAALLQKPYNEFFKVGVATAGNHDNNVYNHTWAERYHGLKEVEVKEQAATQGSGRSGSGQGRSTQGERMTQDGSRQFSVDAADYFYDAETIDDEEVSVEYWTQLARDFEAGLLAESHYTPQQGEQKKEEEQKKEAEKKATTQEKKMKFEIRVPTNAELAGNLKGKLLLIHGEADNNVHPANTLRLVDALIKANKRFDMIYLPNTRHSFGGYQPYVTQRMYEYFAEHLLNDYQAGADILEKSDPPGARK